VRVTPLSDQLGVQVDGVGPVDELTARDVAQLRALLVTRHLLCIRDGEVSGEDQLAFCRLFGAPVGRPPYWYAFTNESGVGGSGRLEFHADYTYAAHPVEGISLHALVLPDRGSSTLFRNAERAYATLPSALRREVDTAWALHVFDMSNPKRREIPARRQQVGFVEPYAVHPLRVLNRRSGQWALYATDMHTELVLGRPRADSDELLEQIMDHFRTPELNYEHDWQPDDLVIWDNVALQHAREDVVSTGVRRFRRISFADEEVVHAVTAWENEQGRSFGHQAIE
jgi:taurine dioxygenase